MPGIPLGHERHIVEMLAVSHPISIPTLMLVAARVKEWLEPLLYRTLVIGCATLEEFPPCNAQRLLAIEPAPTLDFVRNIVAQSLRRDVIELLFTACPNVVNINFQGRRPRVGVAALPRLTHLAFDGLFAAPLSAQLLDTCKALRALVHLDVFGDATDLVTGIDDPRFVVMPLDFWAHSDAFIAKRISGQLPRGGFLLNDPAEEIVQTAA
ncbi:hypothetical protein C8R43DRAFT_956995 [Mycena crocata]|nr:hypothetical protein C8R43DRAFT_956995 [Mycena crocata]